MRVQLNGVPFETGAQTLMELIGEKGLDKGCLVVEYNHNVVGQADWEKTVIKEGDTIELLSFVGGG